MRLLTTGHGTCMRRVRRRLNTILAVPNATIALRRRKLTKIRAGLLLGRMRLTWPRTVLHSAIERRLLPGLCASRAVRRR